MNISLKTLKEETGVGFGTSGIRNKATALTDRVVYCYTKAFMKHVKTSKIALAGDFRESTPRILKAVYKAIGDEQLETIYCGFIPTPAVMFFGIKNNLASIMVTGSHIPADRNGIKFNLASGEVLKEDEAAITEMEVNVDDNLFDSSGYFVDNSFELPEINSEAKEIYINRYVNYFDKADFADRKIGFYGHSSVSREVLVEILEKLGARVAKIDYSEVFVPVDTEAVSDELVIKAKDWMEKYEVESILTTDGDADRPLLTDEDGVWFRADTTGILTAKYLGTKSVVMPVSCNSAAELSGQFDKVLRVKIGSPFVVAGMMKLKYENEKGIVGYEANGGFFIMDNIEKEGKVLEALPTRDALVVLLSILAEAKREKVRLVDLRNGLPQRFTWSSSVKGFPTEKALEVVGQLENTRKTEVENIFGEIRSINNIDGARIYLESGNIVHFRPSLNSPEFRNYVEASSETEVKEMSNRAIELIKKWAEELGVNEQLS